MKAWCMLLLFLAAVFGIGYFGTLIGSSEHVEPWWGGMIAVCIVSTIVFCIGFIVEAEESGSL